MKKALLTVLIVLLSLTAVFANYGIDVDGTYVTTFDDFGDEEALVVSFKPYISGDNYKLQLKFDWSYYYEKFSYLWDDFDDTNFFTVTNSVFKFIDNAYVSFGDGNFKASLTTEDNLVDLVYYGYANRRSLYNPELVTFDLTGKTDSFDFDFTVENVNFPSLGNDYYYYDMYILPATLSTNYVASGDFAVELFTNTKAEYVWTVDDYDDYYDMSAFYIAPEVGFVLPLSINGHAYEVSFAGGTEYVYCDGFDSDEDYEVALFDNWNVGTSVSSAYGPVSFKAGMSFEHKDSYSYVSYLNYMFDEYYNPASIYENLLDYYYDLGASYPDNTIAFDVDVAYEFDNGSIEFAAYVPLNGNFTWKGIGDMTLDKCSISASFKNSCFSFDASASLNNFIGILKNDVAWDYIFGNEPQFVNASAGIGFTTDAFDLSVGMKVTSWDDFDAVLTASFKVNAENFFN